MSKPILFSLLLIASLLAAMPVLAHTAFSEGDVTIQGNQHECDLAAGNQYGWAEINFDYGHDARWPYDID